MPRYLTRTIALWTGMAPAVLFAVQSQPDATQASPGDLSPAQEVQAADTGENSRQDSGADSTGATSSSSTDAVAHLARRDVPTELILSSLVIQLGAPQFDSREAAARELRGYGLAARGVLTQALTHPDPEVRLRARNCLNSILDDDRDHRLAIAQDDPAQLDRVDLPGWLRFGETIGRDETSRALFLEFFAAEPRLLESAAAGDDATVESLSARCHQLDAFRQLAVGKAGRDAEFASVAALLFVATDPRVQLSETLQTEVLGHLNRAAFQTRLMETEVGPLRRLLAAWIHRTADSPITYQNLLIASRYDVKETLPVARRLAEDRAASAESRMYAILLVGKLGDLRDARWMTQFLDDPSVCSSYAYLREGARGRYETQIRDVALATAIHLTGQNHDEYGFTRLRGHSQMLFNTSSIGFPSGEADREQALTHWRAWESGHPLSESPLVAPPLFIKQSFGALSGPASPRAGPDAGAIASVRIAQRGAPLAAPAGGNQAANGGVPVAIAADNDDDSAATKALSNLPPFYLTDRQVRVWLSRAEEFIAAKQYADAVQLIDAALNSPLANSFQPERLLPIHVGIRAEAERLLSQLPAAGQRVYELHVGSSAARQLQAAAASGNPLSVADVARRYFYTEAGAEAELLWGAHLYDAQRPVAAAAAFERVRMHPAAAKFEPDVSFRLATALMKAGYRAEAERVIQSIGTPPSGSVFVLGAQRFVPGPRTPYTPAIFAQWLTQAVGPVPQSYDGLDWPIYGGNPARNLLVHGESPLLRARWSVQTVARPEIQDAVDALTNAYAEERRAAVPGAHPIAVGNVVIARTPTGLLAVKTSDGTPVWRVEFDAALEARLINELKAGQEHLLYRELDERMWGDAASGRLTSDGVRVYAIDNSGQVGDALSQRMIVTPSGRRRLEPRWRDDQNRLVAFDLASEGKTAWTVGGPEGQYQLPLAGTYFLGPPLPLGGQLYVLVERQQMIQLLALDATTGNVTQTLTLASLEPDDMLSSSSQDSALKHAARHAQRRCGAMPSYQDGILVCPTSEGGFAGVDLAQAEVLWTYHATPRYVRDILKFWQTPDEEPISVDPREPRLLDGEVLISGQSVLVAPLELNALLCLDLKTGVVRWQTPLEDLRYIAASADSTVVLVGRSTIRGLKLATGAEAWPRLTLPPGSAPAGRGFASGNAYYLPLTTAEMAVIDLGTGNIRSRLKSQENHAPGNLICVRDYVVSQRVDRLEIFEQLSFALGQAEAEAAREPTAAALMRYGEILMYAGDHEAACRQLQRAFQLQPDEHTLRLLADSLLEALGRDYDRFEPLAQDLLAAHRLEIGVEKQREFLRIRAEHERQAGHIVAAYAATLDLLNLAGDTQSLIARRPTLDASEEAWIRGQLKQLLWQASEEDAQAIDQLVFALYSSQESDPELLARFATYFPDHPLADDARRKLIAESAPEDPLEHEQLLLELIHSRYPQIRREYKERLTWLLMQNTRTREAGELIADLAQDLPTEEDRRQYFKKIVAEMTGNETFEPSDFGPPIWPTVVKREESSELRASFGRRYMLQIDEARDSLENDLQLEVRSDAQLIIASNAVDVKRWEADLRPATGESMLPMNAEALRARQVGHALIIWRGHEIVAIDLMSPASIPARVLWRRTLTTSFPGRPLESNVVVRAAARPGELPRLTAFDSSGLPLGMLGPVNRRYVAYQRGHTLEVVRPLDGEILWRRHDLAPGSQILGDEDFLIYVEPESTIGVVLSADSGREIGRVTTPELDTWVSTIGRRIVSWNAEAPARLRIVDPAEALTTPDISHTESKVIYEREFAPGARVWRIGWDEVAVCDPTGAFVIVNANTGKSIIKAELPPQPKMNALYVLRSQDRYVVVVSSPTETGDTVFAVPGGYQCPLVNGMAYGFDRKERTLVWQVPVENLSLELDQVEHLPVLTFASRMLGPPSEPAQTRRYSSRVLCLDKRTGEVLIDETEDGSISRLETIPDYQGFALEIRTTQNSYRLKFEPSETAKKDGDGD